MKDRHRIAWTTLCVPIVSLTACQQLQETMQQAQQSIGLGGSTAAQAPASSPPASSPAASAPSLPSTPGQAAGTIAKAKPAQQQAQAKAPPGFVNIYSAPEGVPALWRPLYDDPQSETFLWGSAQGVLPAAPSVKQVLGPYRGAKPVSAPSLVLQQRADRGNAVTVRDAVNNPFTFAMSNDGRRYVYVDRMGSRFALYENGEAGPAFDEILVPTIKFSQDGEQLFYVGRRGSGFHAVIDGVEGPAFEHIDMGDVSFHPFDGTPVYIGRLAEGQRLMVGQTAMPEVRGVESYALDPTSQAARFRGWQRYTDDRGRSKNKDVVFDGQAIVDASYDEHDPFFFLPDGRFVGVEVEEGRNGRRRVVVDGTPGPWVQQFTRNSRFTTTSGGELAYSAVVVKPEHEERRAQGSSLNSDGYFQPVVVVGEQVAAALPGERYDTHPNILMSDDGARFAFTSPVQDQYGRVVVIDSGKAGFEYDAVYGLRVSADGSTVRYLAQSGDGLFEVINGEEREIARANFTVEDARSVNEQSRTVILAQFALPDGSNEVAPIFDGALSSHRWDEIETPFFDPAGQGSAYVGVRRTAASSDAPGGAAGRYLVINDEIVLRLADEGGFVNYRDFLEPRPDHFLFDHDGGEHLYLATENRRLMDPDDGMATKFGLANKNRTLVKTAGTTVAILPPEARAFTMTPDREHTIYWLPAAPTKGTSPIDHKYRLFFDNTPIADFSLIATPSTRLPDSAMALQHGPLSVDPCGRTTPDGRFEFLAFEDGQTVRVSYSIEELQAATDRIRSAYEG